MKLLAFLLIFTTVLAVHITAKYRVYKFGRTLKTSNLLMLETYKVKSQKDKMVQKNVTYSARRTIDYITVTDMNPNGKTKAEGGTVKILNGGPGHRSVVLSLKSDPDHELIMLVRIYGR